PLACPARRPPSPTPAGPRRRSAGGSAGSPATTSPASCGPTPPPTSADPRASPTTPATCSSISASPPNGSGSNASARPADTARCCCAAGGSPMDSDDDLYLALDEPGADAEFVADAIDDAEASPDEQPLPSK